jgi:outer membrane protein W
VDSGHGPVLQLGVNFFSKDDTFFSIDVKQHFLKSNVTFNKSLLSNDPRASNVKSKVTWNPLTVSAGIGFKF